MFNAYRIWPEACRIILQIFPEYCQFHSRAQIIESCCPDLPSPGDSFQFLDGAFWSCSNCCRACIYARISNLIYTILSREGEDSLVPRLSSASVIPSLKIRIRFDKLVSGNRSMFSESEKKVYEVLDRLGIAYSRLEHPPVFTVEQAEKHWGSITGAHCKNLFLRNKKGNRHYLVILESLKSADLKALTKQLGEDRLSFASPERLMRYLRLEPGAVSPFGLINDSQKEVRVVVDQDLKNAERINFHPNVNTATVGIDFTDFEKFLAWCVNSIRYLQF